jgi:ribA/ribD-fused uncharacterized protein
MNIKIVSFTGKFRFLSNFHPCKLVFDGIEYPSAEHAYVASKTSDIVQRYAIAEMEHPGEVKRLGRKLKIRSDWEKVKVPIMKAIVQAKFDQNPDLMDLLKETRSNELIEGNTWGDRFWGQSPLGDGRNELGKILMSIRDDITRMFE